MSARMTVEELAERSGMTVRNVREHQTRGLLDHPTVEGRKGYYDDRHLARLNLIRELQDEGLNLQAIGWLLHRAPPDTDEVDRLKQALFAPWSSEPPRTYTLAELVERFGDAVSARERAERLGLLAPLGDGTWESPAPRLIEAGAQLVDLGIGPDAALDVVEEVLGHLEAVAGRFVALFLDEVWQPFDRMGRPAERWSEVRDALERLRPIAGEVALAGFQLEMDQEVGRTMAAHAPELRAPD